MIRKVLQKISREFLTAKKRLNSNQQWLHRYLFERNTRAGYIFERALLIAIFASILVVMLESVENLQNKFGTLFLVLEWVFTIFFTIEYILRLYCAFYPIRYATSFFGIIDLVSVIPSYISFFVPGAHAFLIIRILRVFRVFRLFKLIKFSSAGFTILNALKASREKIAVFLIFVLSLVTIMGSIIYLIEGGQDSGFTSIPESVYWAIVTLTTVGYGDIAPVTMLGQLLAAIVMLLGYSVIAVPTGIVSAELAKGEKKDPANVKECIRCGKVGHKAEARYCMRCGEQFNVLKST